MKLFKINSSQAGFTPPQAGFTLMEILIVMVIIGILAAISIGSFQSSQIKARDAERKSDLKQIGIALEAYYNDKGEYPSASVDGRINGCSGESTCEWGSEWQDEHGTLYMVELPADSRPYLTYLYFSDGTEWQLYARLENDLDADAPEFEGEPGNYGISCGSVAHTSCNYGLASSNTSVDEGRTIIAD